jgi:hypothetical protein
MHLGSPAAIPGQQSGQARPPQLRAPQPAKPSSVHGSVDAAKLASGLGLAGRSLVQDHSATAAQHLVPLGPGPQAEVDVLEPVLIAGIEAPELGERGGGDHEARGGHGPHRDIAPEVLAEHVLTLVAADRHELVAVDADRDPSLLGLQPLSPLSPAAAAAIPGATSVAPTIAPGLA